MQRQRKMPGLVCGRADEPAQIGPIKQPHLHAGRGLPGRQAHPTFKEGFRANADAQHQSDETADQRLHSLRSLVVYPFEIQVRHTLYDES